MNKWNKLRRQDLGEIPHEASSNLTAPKIVPTRSTNKVNIRTKPLNFKVSEEFHWQLKELALQEKHSMVEIVERAVAEYRAKVQNKSNGSEISSSQSTKKNSPQ